jgi:hypothetical protein
MRFTLLGPHRMTVSNDFSCLFGHVDPERFWICIYNLDYDLRGPKALSELIQPFGKLIDLDQASRARSDLRCVRVIVEVASRSLIPSLVWFEIKKPNGKIQVIPIRFEVEGLSHHPSRGMAAALVNPPLPLPH